MKRVSALLAFTIILFSSPCLAADTLTVTRSIDGVDTPESKDNAKTRRDSKRTGQDIKTTTKMGKEAAEFTRKFVEGKQVRLEHDVQQKDKYGRTLAYVYLKEGPFVNAEIMKAGYAQVMTIPPNVKHQELFVKLEKEARENRRGLWK
jgi:micrococcal nuclease